MERFDEGFTKVTKFINLYFIGAILFAAIIYVSANVFARYVLGIGGVLGMRDYVGIMLIPIAYLSAAYGWYKRGFITVDIVQSRLKGKALWGCQFVILLVVFIFASMLCYGAVAETIMSYSMGLMAGRATYYSPEWPWRLAMVLGLAMLALRQVLDMATMVRTGQVIPRDREL